ncbi:MULTISPECIES: HAD family hydrolase [unclassified Rhodococcus (in: high G+C Gram-positive bacteria)]|uniref:HAD family hydrolase n=1 Tax=unclassified Rhodococcus (in: high G+C Gram-positive bacteria) TaxID=192944 RepID=UPI000BE48FE7|nr:MULTISPECIES: HAD family hydrolase [unclassified Rhodococcus (in: high G+C Gram-positive bacteria)]
MGSVQDNRHTKPLLIASDVDGTLIDDDEKVSARTRAAVQAAVADGTPFVLSTGRPPRWIAPVVDELGFAPLAVCANGAVVYDSNADRVLSAVTLSTDELGWLADLAMSALPGCGLAAERVGASAHDAATPQFVSSPGYEHAWLNPDNTEMSGDEVLAHPAVKLLIRLPGTSSAAMAATLAPLIGARADLTYSTDKGLIEVSAPGITKASGLTVVAEQLGIPVSGIVAFGDMPNDVPMLTLARHGVAMENAHLDAITAADEVTTSNSADGVARVLERWWGQP